MGQTGDEDGEHGHPSVSNRWWIPIAAVLLLSVAAFILGFGMLFLAQLGLHTHVIMDVVTDALLASIIIGFILIWVAVLALHFDRKYIAHVSEWNPSALYFTMFILPLGFGQLVMIAYLYNRHKYVGVP